MLDLVKQILEFYFKNNKAPTISDLQIKDDSLLTKQWWVFVTFYKWWIVRGSAWNIRWLEVSIINELIISTISALTKDSRFPEITLSESSKLQIRVDEISSMDVLDTSTREWKQENSEIKKLDPVKNGVAVIDRNYDDIAVILPNISAKLLSWEDFVWVLENKLKSKAKFQEKNYIVYSIETKVETNF